MGHRGKGVSYLGPRARRLFVGLCFEAMTGKGRVKVTPPRRRENRLLSWPRRPAPRPARQRLAPPWPCIKRGWIVMCSIRQHGLLSTCCPLLSLHSVCTGGRPLCRRMNVTRGGGVPSMHGEYQACMGDREATARVVVSWTPDAARQV